MHPSAMQLSNEERESREQDRLLPIANISRIMKKVLPEHAKMSKEAKAALQECVSEFIGFITSEASDRLVAEKRKTITGDDSQCDEANQRAN
jgi:nuclear transcription Y subunit beta